MDRAGRRCVDPCGTGEPDHCGECSAYPRKGRVIVEAANGPTSMEAIRLLDERGIVLIPDIVANAGGVTSSYFEQVQGQSNYYWDAQDVVEKVDSHMTAAVAEVHERAERERLSLRDGAYLIAVERVAHA